MKTILILITITLLAACGHNKIHFSNVKSTKEQKVIAESKQQNSKEKPVDRADQSVAINEHYKIQISGGSKVSVNDELILPAEIEELQKLVNQQLQEKEDVDVKTKVHSSVENDKIVASSNKKNGDLYLYGIAALLALSTFGFTYGAKKTTMKLTRWTANNKKTTKTAIAIAQVGIGVLGYLTGVELQNTGYSVSNSTQYISGAIGGAAFLGMYYNDLKGNSNGFNFFKRKFSLAVVCASLFASSMGIGNGLTNSPLNSATTYLAQDTLESNQEVDEQQAKSENFVESADPGEKGVSRRAVQGWYIFLAIILGIAVVVGSCLAFCAWGAAGFWVMIPAVLLYVLFHIGMVRSIKKRPKISRT